MFTVPSQETVVTLSGGTSPTEGVYDRSTSLKQRKSTLFVEGEKLDGRRGGSTTDKGRGRGKEVIVVVIESDDQGGVSYSSGKEDR